MKTTQKHSASSGFTLVELSIVIIIIGFLIAGITAGTSLIKSAELNSVITDFRSYQTAYNNFINRYSQPPGDFLRADSLWPAGVTGCSLAGSCNGNGDGLINQALEVEAAWRELVLADMISANIQATQGVAATPGVNMPISKVPGAGYSMVGGGTDINGFGIGAGAGANTSAVLWGAPSQTNAVFLAKAGAGTGVGLNNNILNVSAYKAEDTFSIDKKIDDGNPNSGSLRASPGSDATGATDCVASSITYNFTTTVTCVVGMALN